jgi:tetratricopeptide (TPR) repeat protein
MKNKITSKFRLLIAVLTAALMIYGCISKVDKTMPVTTTSKKAKALFNEAITQMFDNNSKRTKELLKEAIDLDSTFVAANLYYAFQGFGSIDREKYLKTALENINNVSETEKHLTHSFIAYSKGDKIETIKEMNAAIALSPDDKLLAGVMASIYESYNQYDSALVYAKKRFELDTLSGSAVNYQGYLLWRLDKIDEAEKMYKKSIEINAGNASFYNNYGQMLRGAGRIDEAIAMHKKAIEIKPDYQSYLYLGHCYVANDQFPDARENYLKAYEVADYNGQKTFCLESVGYTYLYEKKLQEALAAFDKRAEFNRQLGKMDVEILNSIMLKTSSCFFYNDLGNADMYINEAKGLISTGEFTETDKSDFSKYLVLMDGFLKVLQGKTEEAEKYLEQFEKSLNETEKNVYYKEDLLEIKGDIQQNRKNYNEAISLYENGSVVSKYYAGLLYEKTGNAEKAKEIYSDIAKNKLTSFQLALVKPFAKEKLAGK